MQKKSLERLLYVIDINIYSPYLINILSKVLTFNLMRV